MDVASHRVHAHEQPTLDQPVSDPAGLAICVSRRLLANPVLKNNPAHRQGDVVLSLIDSVLGGVKLELHTWLYVIGY